MEAAGSATTRAAPGLASRATELRATTLRYLEAMREASGPYGRYRFAEGVAGPVLYASTYGAMTRHLYGELEALGASERAEWVAYLQSHQDDDGLFRDPAIYGEGWYAGDPLWCGRPHLSCHVVTALTCLGAVAAKPLRWPDRFTAPGAVESWLAEREWADRTAWVGNEVMNVGTLLQYARDFQGSAAAGETVSRLLDWLDGHWLDPGTGLWGGLDARDPACLSQLVQAAYHIWPLYLYDGRPVPLLERAIDSVLRTQNPLGGFGWGGHNPDDPWRGSACEDIDSIDPLVRFSAVTGYRRADVLAALSRALPWVLSNQNADGGFVFVRHRAHDYGHPLLQADADVSATFPTWFRTLSLAYLGQALPRSVVGGVPWRFCRCPGVQFWNPGRSAT